MKPSTFLVASGAVLAAASPISVDKRSIETEVVVVMETVTITDCEAHAPASYVAPTTTSTTSTSSHAPPPPASSSTVRVYPTSPAASHVKTRASTTSTAAFVPASTQVEVAASTSAAQTSSGGTAYASVAVDKHNAHRANNSAQAVTYNSEYASAAAQLAATCNFHHDVSLGPGGYGQNIAAWGSSGNVQDIDPSLALGSAIDDMWYNGEQWQYPTSNYGNSNPDMSGFENWGHYTAMVWANTQQIGCASQYCAPGTMYSTMGAYFTVCNYYPAGNVDGEYAANVLPPQGQSTISTNI